MILFTFIKVSMENIFKNHCDILGLMMKCLITKKYYHAKIAVRQHVNI